MRRSWAFLIAAKVGSAVFSLANPVRSSSDHVMYSSMRLFSFACLVRLSCLAKYLLMALRLNQLGTEVGLLLGALVDATDVSLIGLVGCCVTFVTGLIDVGGSAEKSGNCA